MHRHLKLVGLGVGLTAWAIVAGMRTHPATDLSSLQARASDTDVAIGTAQSPERLYTDSCASCHQAQGQGRFPVFPPLAGSPWVNGDSDRLIALTLHGVSGPIDVNGVEYSGLMPGFAHLSDRELAAVLTYSRSAWGNRAPPVSESEVAAVRSATSRRRVPWSAAELGDRAP